MKKFLAALSVGAALIMIPTGATKAEYHVQPGDAFYKIAANHRMTLSDLIKLNPHIKNPNVIHPGDQIVVRTGNTANDIIDYARALEEVTTYVYGGQEAPLRTDCSGWAQAIFKEFGINLPRVSKDQARVGKPVKFNEMKKGDLMFFSTRADKVVTHVGIYMGNDLWISNLNSNKHVEIMTTWGPWTQKYFLWATRVI